MPEETASDDPNPLVDLLRPFWSEQRAAEALGDLSLNELTDLHESGAVLGLTTSSGAVIYPIAQFVRRGAVVRVHPTIVAVLGILNGVDPWIVAVALHSRVGELEELTPLGWARAGRDPRPLITWAKRLGRNLLN